MEESKNTKNALQMLEAFEKLAPIETSEAWNQSLLRKLEGTKPATAFKFSTVPYTAAMLFFMAINSFFIFNVFKKEPPQYKEFKGQNSNRMVALKTISTQLLINTTSIAQ
jgi:hypothetical protein